MEDSEMVDLSSICPICLDSTFVGQTIACDFCDRWYHLYCEGVAPDNPVVTNEDAPFFCSRCRKTKKGYGKNNSGSSVRRPSSRGRGRGRGQSRGRSSRGVSGIVAKEPPASKTPPLTSSGSIKMRLKITGKGPSIIENSVLSERRDCQSIVTDPVDPTEAPSSDMDEEEEERRFCEAAEAGDHSGLVDRELNSIRNPKFKSARQKALAGESDPTAIDHIALDYGFKKKPPPQEETEEARISKEIKSKQRKQAEQARRETEKRDTVHKLLKKRKEEPLNTLANAVGGVGSPNVSANKLSKTTTVLPAFHYRLSVGGRKLSFPRGYKLPLWKAKDPPPQLRTCAAPGCNNPKKYYCSRSEKPACSLPCYQTNKKIYIQSINNESMSI